MRILLILLIILLLLGSAYGYGWGGLHGFLAGTLIMIAALVVVGFLVVDIRGKGSRRR